MLYATFGPLSVAEGRRLEVIVEFIVSEITTSNAVTCLANHSTDGFSTFHVTREESENLEIVGLFHLLPEGVVPMKLNLSAEDLDLVYELAIGREDAKWHNMNSSKKWNAVYLLGTGGLDDGWAWQDIVSGKVKGNLRNDQLG